MLLQTHYELKSRDSLALRGLDGRGHFNTMSISLERRALYKDIGKYSNLWNFSLLEYR